MSALLSLVLAENRHTSNSDPHATGVISIPWSWVETDIQLSHMVAELLPIEREACQQEGVLRFTVDYGFDEDFASGVGMVIEDLQLDYHRLSAEHRTLMFDWIKAHYVEAEQFFVLEDCIANDEVKSHLLVDMTVAGMSLSHFLAVLTDNIEPAEPMTRGDVAKIRLSLQRRGIDNLTDYFQQQILALRQQWPSATRVNYGDEHQLGAQVIFFTGFLARESMVIKFGQYAYRPAWPSFDGEVSCFDHYDEHGIARDEYGDIVEAVVIFPNRQYVYHPYMLITQQIDRQQFFQVLDRWRKLSRQSIWYDGYGRNCLSVAGHALFGEVYVDLVERYKASAINIKLMNGEVKLEGPELADWLLCDLNNVPDTLMVQSVTVELDMPDDDPLGVKKIHQ